jgi:hypothetical protein
MNLLAAAREARAAETSPHRPALGATASLRSRLPTRCSRLNRTTPTPPRSVPSPLHPPKLPRARLSSTVRACPRAACPRSADIARARAAGVSFNLELSEAERKQRAAVALPFQRHLA